MQPWVRTTSFQNVVRGWGDAEVQEQQHGWDHFCWTLALGGGGNAASLPASASILVSNGVWCYGVLNGFYFLMNPFSNHSSLMGFRQEPVTRGWNKKYLQYSPGELMLLWGCEGWNWKMLWVQALQLLRQETPAVVCCGQPSDHWGSPRHSSLWQGQCLEGGKMKRSLPLLNSLGMKKPLMKSAETQSFKHSDDLESLGF